MVIIIIIFVVIVTIIISSVACGAGRKVASWTVQRCLPMKRPFRVLSALPVRHTKGNASHLPSYTRPQSPCR